MIFVSFLIQLLAAVYLLLFAIRTVQGGVERSFGNDLRQYLAKPHRTLSYLGIGSGLALALQSATASTILCINLSKLGYLSISSAIAIVIGADFGSAITAIMLSLKIQWLMPVLMVIGGWMFLKSGRTRLQNLGRIFFGVSLILLSLQLIGNVMAPVRDSDVFGRLSDFLNNDYISAFLLGAVIAFLLHSSVAAVLMCNLAVVSGAVELETGMAIVLGVNFGAGLMVAWLTRENKGDARAIPMINLALRSTLAVAFLLAFETHILRVVSEEWIDSVLVFHLLFNACLLPFAFLAQQMSEIASHVFVTASARENAEAPPVNILDPNVLSQPALALICLRRELVRMSEVILEMSQPVLGLYEDFDEETAQKVINTDKKLNNSLTEIRNYIAEIPHEIMSKSQRKDARRLIDVAVDLEAAGDVISKKLVRFARIVHDENLQFSKEGRAEIRALYLQVLSNMQRNFGLLLQEDTTLAREVIEEKSKIRAMEAKSRKSHFKRLQNGEINSLESSDMHFETLSALRELNSKSSTIAYRILDDMDQLLVTRIKSKGKV